MDFDRGSGKLVKGRYIGAGEFKRHRERLLQTGIATARLTHIPENLTPPLLVFPTVPDLSSILRPPEETKAGRDDGSAPPPWSVPHNPQVSGTGQPSSSSASKPAPRARKTESRSSTVEINFFQTKLRQIQSRFKTFRTKDLANWITEEEPLIFVNPPAASMPPLVPDSIMQSTKLDPDAAVNSTIIAHEEWLLETQEFINKHLPMGRNVHTRLLARLQLSHTVQELAEIDRIKVKEWERQHKIAVNAGPSTVDTGKNS